MKGFVVLAVAVLLAIGIGISIESMQPSRSNLLGPPSTQATGQGLVRVAARGPCPTRLDGARDVSNSGTGLRSRLLPSGALFGRICRYRASGLSSVLVLVRSALVNGRSTNDFARAIASISLRRPSGVANCPMQVPGATILAFGFAGRSDVDLWYNDSGCQTLDNGSVTAFELENPAFSNFIALLNELAPLGSTEQ